MRGLVKLGATGIKIDKFQQIFTILLQALEFGIKKGHLRARRSLAGMHIRVVEMEYNYIFELVSFFQSLVS